MSGFSHNITRLRKERGVTKAHLARQIGVSRCYITRLENGSLRPGAEVMLRLAGYFRRPVEEVFQLASVTANPLSGCYGVKAARQPAPPSAGSGQIVVIFQRRLAVAQPEAKPAKENQCN